MTLNQHKNYVISASLKCSKMGKLINRIPGSRLLISSLPGSALRTHVESLGKPRDVNMRSQSPALYSLFPTYRMNIPSAELTSPCNLECQCDTQKFEPVCGSDSVMYFTPCHAGCSYDYIIDYPHHNKVLRIWWSKWGLLISKFWP